MTPPEGQVDFDAFLLLIGKLNYTWTNTESLLIHLIAGLCKIDKNTALIIFLTLNTTRARIDLVNRLAKRDGVSAKERDASRVSLRFATATTTASTPSMRKGETPAPS